MDTKSFDLSNYFDFSRLDDVDYIKSKGIILKEKDGFKILKYNRDYLNTTNINSLGLFRSVVVKDCKVISFAPPKSCKLDNVLENYNTESKMSESLTFEEYIEGTMINVFYDGEEWRIASRSLIGANGQFYNNGKTFRRMFLEALNNCTLEFDDLNTKYCYSFVFQHPENRIVIRCKCPKLYLCAVYDMCDDDSGFIREVNFSEDKDLCSKVDIPQIYSAEEYGFKDWDLVHYLFANTDVEPTPYYIMGVVVKDYAMGIRTKIRNPNYEFVRELRGNQSKLQYQYYNLRRMGRVRDYLRFYKEDSDEFNRYREQLHIYTQNLHNYYVLCYVHKEKPLKEFPYEYRSHMYTLHQKYLDYLRPIQRRITYQEVMTYINTLEPARLMYTMNYRLRQQTVDDKKDVVENAQQ